MYWGAVPQCTGGRSLSVLGGGPSVYWGAVPQYTGAWLSASAARAGGLHTLCLVALSHPPLFIRLYLGRFLNKGRHPVCLIRLHRGPASGLCVSEPPAAPKHKARACLNHPPPLNPNPLNTRGLRDGLHPKAYILRRGRNPRPERREREREREGERERERERERGRERERERARAGGGIRRAVQGRPSRDPGHLSEVLRTVQVRKRGVSLFPGFS